MDRSDASVAGSSRNDEQADLARAEARIGGPYAYYVLGVFVLVYAFNFIDRQIISILAVDIKAAYNLRDQDLGFLYGTAFAVFYAIFGIPLGRLADVWLRGRLMAIGLALWSLMTAVSGLTVTFGQLAVARFGVAVGEASAAPAAFSMLSDYFPRSMRATALAIYSSGIYIGGGVSLFVGGVIVEGWDRWFAVTAPPLGLAGWQAAFLAVGLPGLILAVLVATIKEPVRGLADGMVSKRQDQPWARFWEELFSVFPGLTIWSLIRQGAPRKIFVTNIVFAVLFIVSAFFLTLLTGDMAQWVAFFIGAYAVFSWIQSLKLRDPATYHLIWGTPAFLLTVVGFGTMSFVTYSTSFWLVPYARAELGLDAAEVGLVIGLAAAIGGWLGVTSGGIVADLWRKKTPQGRLYLGMVSAALTMPIGFLALQTDNPSTFYVLVAAKQVVSTMWIGVAAATCQDLVLPRMRGAAAAGYVLGTTFIGLALGPYSVGKLSQAFGDRGLAISCAFSLGFVVILLLVLASRRIDRAEATRVERARAHGELF
ncbi:MAG: MFS transporter [Pseudomonadota bacterium]